MPPLAVFLGPVGDDPQGTEVRRLGIRPGDVLVVKLDHFADEAEAEHIKQSVAGAFKGSGYTPPVLVVEIGAEIGVIGPEADGA
jgi:hypothetical protein